MNGFTGDMTLRSTASGQPDRNWSSAKSHTGFAAHIGGVTASPSDIGRWVREGTLTHDLPDREK